MGEGDLAGAAEILDSADVSNAPAEVRAQFRFTMFSLGWRTRGKQDRMVGALDSIKHDPDAPSALREVAELMLDANPARRPAQSLPAIAHRLQAVAATMANQRLTFYSAISLHDSAVAYLNAGEFVRSLEAGSQALDQFGHLAFFQSNSSRRTQQWLSAKQSWETNDIENSSDCPVEETKPLTSQQSWLLWRCCKEIPIELSV